MGKATFSWYWKGHDGLWSHRPLSHLFHNWVPFFSHLPVCVGHGGTDIFVVTHVYGYKCLELTSGITFNECLDTLFTDAESLNQSKISPIGLILVACSEDLLCPVAKQALQESYHTQLCIGSTDPNFGSHANMASTFTAELPPQTKSNLLMEIFLAALLQS